MGPDSAPDRSLGITLLGATGSIGLNTLDVIARHPGCYRIVALTAHRDVAGLLRLCRAHAPEFAVMADADCAMQLEQGVRGSGLDTCVLSGVEGLVQVAGLEQVDIVMAAIVGAAGLLPTLEAARRGKRILLANKEALVMSGALFMDEMQRSGAVLLPVDSEHNAIFQCMPAGFSAGRRAAGIRRIVLTASGGPFRTLPVAELDAVTPEQACAHPNWEMGPKISVDSATMMNKGLEVIEACWLFGMHAAEVTVVLHPQSVIHSMVDYADGSVLAQLGNPDMRTPIAHALAWPERIESGAKPLDILETGRLDFEAVDLQRFPALRLAYEAWEQRGTAAAILNAANEVAVRAFLERRLAFTGIPRIIEATLARCASREANSLDVILEDDAVARDTAMTILAGERRKVAP